MTRRALTGPLAVAISLAVALVLAEAGLQIADIPPSGFSPWVSDDDTAYRYASGVHTRMRRLPEFDVLFETNSAGLRDDEIEERTDGRRILLLGDSFASGYGVERGAMFADLLEQGLARKSEDPVEVINAGVGGYEIVHQLYYFAGRGRELDPDVVVYALYLGNDLSRNGEWVETPRGLRSATREFPTRPKRDVKLARLLRQARYALRERSHAAKQPWVPFPDYLELCERDLGERARGWYERSRELIGELRELVEDSGARFVVAPFSFRTVIDPTARSAFENSDVEKRYDLDRPEREMLAILDAYGIETINLNDALRSYHDHNGPGRPLYFEIDGHFNEEGHRVVAEALIEFLGVSRQAREARLRVERAAPSH